MSDPTEDARRAIVEAQAVRNAEKAITRSKLEAEYGQVWDTDQLCADFKVDGFGAPFVVVTRKSDGVRGSLEFQHMPRFYYNFQPA